MVHSTSSRIRRAIQRLTHRAASDAQTIELNRRLRGYPRNHNYRVCDGAIVPSRKLRERADSIARALPVTMGNLLDIGSCKGFFVLEAVLSSNCRTAVGIDVHEPFVALATDVRNHLKRENAHFHLASLDAVAEQPQRFGGPFQTVLLISTYHYLYWGSALEPKAFSRHETILAMLARTCTKYLIFANPLEIGDCPKIIQSKALAHGSFGFCRDTFIHTASQYFDVFEIGCMDRKHKRPLLILVNRMESDVGAQENA